MKTVSRQVKKFLKERGWDDLLPSDLAKSICIEAAELLELFQWDNPRLLHTKKDRVRISKIKDELADVLIYCIEMAVLLNIDAEKIILDKLKRSVRKYPAALMRKQKKAADSIYWQLKQQHRAKTAVAK